MLTLLNKDHSHSHSHKHKHELPLHKHTHHVIEPEVNTFAHFTRHISRDKDARKLCILLMINLVVTVLEVVYGFISNSIGLISDAAHMLFDSTALAVGIYASYKAKLPANKKFSYGYERFQTLAGFVNGIFLIFIAFYILIESLERIYDPPVIQSDKMIVVAVIGLIVNLIGVIFFHEHAHFHGGEGEHSCSHSHSHSHKNDHKHDHHHHHESHSHHSLTTDSSVPSTQNSLKESTSLEDTDHVSHRHQHDHSEHHNCNHHHHDHELEHLHQPSQSDSHQDHDHHDHHHNHEEHEGHNHSHDHADGPNENLYGVFLHILADLLGSVGVIASSILIMLFGWYITDAICSAITSVLILVSVIPLLKSSVMVFMQTYPAKHEKQFHQILSDISNHPAVLECKEPHLWAFTHEKLVCSMILVLRHNTPDINKVVRYAKEKLNQLSKIKYITIDYQVDRS